MYAMLSQIVRSIQHTSFNKSVNHSFNSTYVIQHVRESQLAWKNEQPSALTVSAHWALIAFVAERGHQAQTGPRPALHTKPSITVFTCHEGKL